MYSYLCICKLITIISHLHTHTHLHALASCSLYTHAHNCMLAIIIHHSISLVYASCYHPSAFRAATIALITSKSVGASELGNWGVNFRKMRVKVRKIRVNVRKRRVKLLVYSHLKCVIIGWKQLLFITTLLLQLLLY